MAIADSFLGELDRALDAISEMPDTWPSRCLLDKGKGKVVSGGEYSFQEGRRARRCLLARRNREKLVQTADHGDPGTVPRCRRSRSSVRIQDVFRKDFGRLIVYARIDDGTVPPTWVWWGADIEARPGHVETLDDIFCALERELSALRRTVKKYAPDFLEDRGRELPSGVR